MKQARVVAILLVLVLAATFIGDGRFVVTARGVQLVSLVACILPMPGVDGAAIVLNDTGQASSPDCDSAPIGDDSWHHGPVITRC